MTLRNIILPISSLFFTIGFLAIGYGMILTYVGVYLKSMGVSNLMIGIINALFFLGAIGSSIFSQKIISTVGHIRSFATFGSIMVISFLLHSIIFNEVLWGLLRFCAGFSFYALLIIIESWLNEKSEVEYRGKILAIYTIVFYLCTAIGQYILSIDFDLAELIFVIGSILVLCSMLFISLTKIKEPILKPFEKYSLPKIVSVVPLATVTSFIGGFFVGGFFTMIPVYLMSQYDSIQVVSFFMLITLLGGLVSQWPIGLLSDKYGRRKLIAFCALFTAFVSLGFIFYGSSELFLYIFGFLLGITIFAFYPLGLARANDVVDENKDILEISRTLLFTYGVGSFLAPLCIGIGLGFYDQFLFLVFLVFGIFLYFYSLSKEKIPDEDMSVFVNVPVASGEELAQLDPRHDEK